MAVVKRLNQFLYKSKDNSLVIDKRINTYDYEFQMNRANIYVFDLNYDCTYANDVVMNTKMIIQKLFPEDLFDFIQSLVSNTVLTKSQIIHVKINDIHVLFRSSQCMDHMNNVIGCIIYELPFSNVQNVKFPEINYAALQRSYILDTDYNVFAIEEIHWDLWLKEFTNEYPKNIQQNYLEKKNTKYLLGKQHLEILDSVEEFNYYCKLLKHIATHDETIKFCIYSDTQQKELRILISISKFIGLEDKCLFLLNNDIIDENDHEIKKQYINVVENFKDNGRCFYNCVYCNRIQQIVDEATIKKTFKNHVIYYHQTVPPLYHSEFDVPCFGKRGKSGQQTYKILIANAGIYKVWMDLDQWKEHNSDKVRIDEIFIYKTVCDLCNDEWSNFFLSLNIQP